MSRPFYPVVSNQQQVNFGVVNRINRIDYVDYPQRTQAINPVVIPWNTGSTPVQLTAQQVQENTLIVYASGGTGSASSTFLLPTAQSLLQAFNGMQVGRSVRLNIVNKGPSVASFFACPGSGQVVAGQVFGATGGPTGSATSGVLPFLQGVNVAPIGVTIVPILGTGGSNLTGASGVEQILNGVSASGITLGSRSIDLEFVSISPNPLNLPYSQFVTSSATGAYTVY